MTDSTSNSPRSLPEYAEYGWTGAAVPECNRLLLSTVVEMVKRVPPPARVVDLGCGTGFIAAQLANLGYEVWGIDASEQGIALARQAYPGVRFAADSIYNSMEYLGSNLDCVISLEVIEHLYLPRILMQRAFDLLRSQGIFILSTPHHGYLKNLALSVAGGWDRHFGVAWDGGHVKFFSRATLTKMARDVGFMTPRFRGVGRLPYLWHSDVMVAAKP